MEVSICRLEMLLPKEGDVRGPKLLEPYRDGEAPLSCLDRSVPLFYHEEMLECIRKMDELSEQGAGPRGYPLAVKGWLCCSIF